MKNNDQLKQNMINDLSCPITQEIFRDPYVTNCGDVFEKEAIEKLIKVARNEGRRAKCPLCRKEISNITPDKQVKKQVNNLLEAYPELKSDQHELPLSELLKSLIIDSSKKQQLIDILTRQPEIKKQPIDSSGSTLLHFAAQNGCAESCRLLIQLGVSTTAVNKDGKTAQQIATGEALVIFEERQNILCRIEEMLLLNQLELLGDTVISHVHSIQNVNDFIDRMINYIKTEHLNLLDTFKNAILLSTIKHNDLHLFQIFSEKLNVSIDRPLNASGNTALHFFAKGNNIEGIKMVLSMRGDINKTDIYNQTAIAFAASCGSIEALQLLSKNKDIDLTHVSKNHQDKALNGMTLLHWAAASGNLECCQLLCHSRALLSAVNELGKTPENLASTIETKIFLKDLKKYGLFTQSSEHHSIVKKDKKDKKSCHIF